MAIAAANRPAVRARLNYFDPALARGRFDIVDPARTTMAFEGHEVEIHDMRHAARPPSLAREGFTLSSHRSALAFRPDLLDANLTPPETVPDINRAYHDELLPLIAQLSGAREVIAQQSGLVVRFSGRSPRQSWAEAAGFIHLDVTQTSVQPLLDASVAAADRPIAPYRRFVLLQTWRAVSPPPQDNLLALCDRQSVSASDVAHYDAVMAEKGSMLESVEARSCRYNPAHRWSYVSAMGAEDVIVFTGYDSADPEGIQPFHSGFELPDQPGATPRISLEARFFAFYD